MTTDYMPGAGEKLGVRIGGEKGYAVHGVGAAEGAGSSAPVVVLGFQTVDAGVILDVVVGSAAAGVIAVDGVGAASTE